MKQCLCKTGKDGGGGGAEGGGAGINKMCYGNVKVANITGLPLFVTKAKARISIPVFNSWTQNYQKVFFGIFEGVPPDNKFHGQKQK